MLQRGERGHICAAASLSLLLSSLPSLATALDLQGHRGARGLLPENTMPGFRRAIEIGVSTLELDLAVTRDGRVVVSHDQRLSPALARDANGDWVREPAPSINSMTWDDLQRFDVGRLQPGTRYARRFETQRSIDGTRIPDLSEVFSLAAGNPRLQFNIETKLSPFAIGMSPPPAQFAQAVLDVVRQHRLEARVIVQSFDWRTLRHIQREEPAIRTACLTAQQKWLDNVRVGQPGPSPWTAGLDVDDYGGEVAALVAAAGCRIWSPNHKDVSANDVARAHAAGLQVIVWTVNERARMRQMIAMGVDGIISDYPDRLVEVAALAGGN